MGLSVPFPANRRPLAMPVRDRNNSGGSQTSELRYTGLEFVRLARIAPPRPPGGEVIARSRRRRSPPVPGPLWQRLMPVVMVVAVRRHDGLMFAMSGKSHAEQPDDDDVPDDDAHVDGRHVRRVSRGGGGKTAGELNEERKDYFRYLDQTPQGCAEHRGSSSWNRWPGAIPHPIDLHALVGTRRMWERRPNDPDFGHVRVGVGSHRLATKLARPETGPLEDLEPVSTVALRRFVRTHSVVHGLPTAVSLRAFPAINIEGPRGRRATLVRAMMMELTAFHGPDNVAVAVVCADPDGPAWAWAKWLPHLQHPLAARRHGLGAR